MHCVVFEFAKDTIRSPLDMMITTCRYKRLMFNRGNVSTFATNREETIFLIAQYWETDICENVTPTKYQRFVMMMGDYHVKYCVSIGLDKTNCIYSDILSNIESLS